MEGYMLALLIVFGLAFGLYLMAGDSMDDPYEYDEEHDE